MLVIGTRDLGSELFARRPSNKSLAESGHDHCNWVAIGRSKLSASDLRPHSRAPLLRGIKTNIRWCRDFSTAQQLMFVEDSRCNESVNDWWNIGKTNPPAPPQPRFRIRIVIGIGSSSTFSLLDFNRTIRIGSLFFIEILYANLIWINNIKIIVFICADF